MKYFTYFFLFIYLSYFSQGILYEEESIFSKGLLLCFFGICGWGIIKVLMDKPNGFSKILLLFVLVQFVYFLFSTKYAISGTHRVISSFPQLKSIFISLLPFYPLYYCARRDNLSSGLLFFLVACLALYIFRFFNMQHELVFESGQDSEAVVNNMSYAFIKLLPFTCLLFNRKIFSMGIWGCCMGLILLGAKRGAILTGIVAAILYIWYLLKHTWREKNGFYILLICIVVAIGGYFGYRFILSNDFVVGRFLELAEGNDSGRTYLYVRIFDYWKNTPSLLHLLFGFGFNSSITIAGNLAHNDWLELLSCCGVFGVIIYSLLFIQAIRYIRLLRQTPALQSMLVMIIICWLAMSAFSMGYTDMTLFSILLGYIMGTRESAAYNNIECRKVNGSYAHLYR